MSAVDELKQELGRQDRPQPDDGKTVDFHSVERHPDKPRATRSNPTVPAVDRGRYDPAVVNHLPCRTLSYLGAALTAAGIVTAMAVHPMAGLAVAGVGLAGLIAGLAGFPASGMMAAVERAYGVRILSICPFRVRSPRVLYVRNGEGGTRAGRLIAIGLNVWLADMSGEHLEPRR